MKLNACISINSGASLLLFIASFFGLLWMVRGSEAIERVFPVASGMLTWAFTSFLVKRNANRKRDNEAVKADQLPEAPK